MRFGGHETFHIREGWLPKGVKLLHEAPAKLVDEYAADWLGVGRNMAKSIRHWLVATGLADPKGTSRKLEGLKPTELSTLIAERDPYFLESGTWWALHVNLVHSEQHAFAWNWFFNNFRVGRFEKPVCLQGLSRHVAASLPRIPSARTLERDVACLLSTYSRRLPPTSDDPEEALDCPMVELGLLTHYRDSGVYQLHLQAKPIPPMIIGYAVQAAFRDELRGKPEADIQLRPAVSETNSPGAVFALTGEALFEVVSVTEEQTEGAIRIAGQASQRVIRIKPKTESLKWLDSYYVSLEGGRDAA